MVGCTLVAESVSSTACTTGFLALLHYLENACSTRVCAFGGHLRPATTIEEGIHKISSLELVKPPDDCFQYASLLCWTFHAVIASFQLLASEHGKSVVLFRDARQAKSWRDCSETRRGVANSGCASAEWIPQLPVCLPRLISSRARPPRRLSPLSA